METAPIHSVQFNKFSEIVRPLHEEERNITLNWLAENDITWGTNSYTLVDAQWLLAELETIRDNTLRISKVRMNKAIKRVTAAWIDMES